MAPFYVLLIAMGFVWVLPALALSALWAVGHVRRAATAWSLGKVSAEAPAGGANVLPSPAKRAERSPAAPRIISKNRMTTFPAAEAQAKAA